MKKLSAKILIVFCFFLTLVYLSGCSSSGDGGDKQPDNDTTPASFAFNPQTGAALSTLATSNSITVSGINADAGITISGANGTYSINGGAYTNAAGTVSDSDSVTVRLTSSSAYNTAVSTTLTIGGVSASFTVTTLVESSTPVVDTTPDAFNFAAVTDAEPGSVKTSNSITVSGINEAAAISISGAGGTYSINDGPYTNAAGTVSSGNTVKVKVTASANNNTAVSTTLTIGGVASTYTVTTGDDAQDEDTTPAAFNFSAQSLIALNTPVVSNQITVSGITADTEISIADGLGWYSINGGAYTNSPGTVANEDTVRIRLTSSSTYSTTVSTTLNIGGVQSTFSVTTRAEVPVTDTTPDPFTFTSQTNAPISTIVISNEITVTGINTTTQISISGANATYSINEEDFTIIDGMVNVNDTVRIRLITPSDLNTTVSATLTIGSVTATFNVTTIEDNTEELRLDPAYYGSWKASPTYGDCTEIKIATFSSDRTYSVINSNECGSVIENIRRDNGTWGLTADERMFVDSATGSDGYVYSFITSTGKLSIQGSESVFTRDGEGTGLVGTWINTDNDDGENCNQTLTFTDTDFTYNKECLDAADEEYSEGTYTINDDEMIITLDGGDVDHEFFKIFNDTVLSIEDIEELYSVYDEANVARDSDLFGSWFYSSTSEEGTGRSGMYSFSIDGGFYIANDDDIDDENDPEEGYGSWQGENGLLQIIFEEMYDGSMGKTLYYYIVSSGDLLITDNYLVRTAGTTGLVGSWEGVDNDCTVTYTFNGDGTCQSETVCTDPDDNDSITGTYEAHEDIIIFDDGYEMPYHIINNDQWLIGSDLYSRFGSNNDTDTTPEPFVFTPQTDAPISDNVFSNEITVMGINTPTSISIVGSPTAAYSINGGAFTNTPGTVNCNDTVIIRLTTPSDVGVTVTAELTIGDVSSTFIVTTSVVNPDDLTLDPDYFGSWISTETYDGCKETSFVMFSDDGTYYGIDTQECAGNVITDNGSDYGIWGFTEEGLLYMNSATDDDGYLYSFITSDNKLAMCDSMSSNAFIRQGDGTGITGTWIQNQAECNYTLTFTDTRFTYTIASCPDSSNNGYYEGSYTVDGDVLTATYDDGEIDYQALKIFNDNVLTLHDFGDLYSFYPEGADLDRNLFGSWFFDQTTPEGISMSEMLSFSTDGSFYITYDDDIDDGVDGEEGSGTWSGENGLLQIVFTEMSDGTTEKTLYYYIMSSGDLLITDAYFERTSGTTGLVGSWEKVDEDCTDTLTLNDDSTFEYESSCVDPDENESSSGTYTADDETILLNNSRYLPYHMYDNNQRMIVDSQLHSKLNSDPEEPDYYSGSLKGTWVAEETLDNGCVQQTTMSFNEDWSVWKDINYDCPDDNDDFSYDDHGSFETTDDGGVILTLVNDGVIRYENSMFTSTGKLALSNHTMNYNTRVGEGTGLVGSWSFNNSDCQGSTVYNADGTWTYEDQCGEESDQDSGTYTSDAEKLYLASIPNSETYVVIYSLTDNSHLVTLEAETLYTKLP